MFNLANSLTLARIVAAPLIVLLLYFVYWYQWRFAASAASVLFLLASLTDLFDGLVARRQGRITSMGKFLDPLADKLLVGSVLIMLVKLCWAPAWVVIIIICRELLVTGVRAMAAEKGEVMAADNLGKLKTIVQLVAIIALTWHYPLFGLNPAAIGLVLLYLALVFTVFSGGNYLYSFYKKWLAA
ncbi:MAG: CDP-diacylglycerol--glycerol-3-phosphate 3-phosphatidyltransferase [Desulfovibrionaceae bacterium]|nr:CDP-diacylglycerol--glycerol-3-phosphate 3-phosphatidyltransferase [Desulfovibrionaceae bacterium]